MGMVVTNQNCIHKEIKGRLNSENACYHVVNDLLSSHLISKNVCFLCGCGTLSLRLRGFDNRVLRRIFEFKSIEVTGG
jgi:hypothetical protein